METPLEILKKYWGHTQFKPLQEDIINSVLENEDTLALLPTAGGKSICFQIPAIIKDGICIVISPLIALMKDQVSTLNAMGIKSMAITSGISYNELDTQLDNCIYGNYKFLYLSPERLQQPLVQERIEQMNVNLIAVDEAHCISQWGHDFRPTYRTINLLRNFCPTANIIALTATAKPEVVEEIISELDMISPKIFRMSYNRPNIGYHIIEKEDKKYQLKSILDKIEGPSIVYVRSRRAAEEIAKYLRENKIDSQHFHGGMDSRIKGDRLLEFMQEKIRVMVATTAFGMGIDKPNIRTVIHYNLPENLESYYQEAGRAGRDGLKSDAIIIIDKNDGEHLKKQFLYSLPTLEFIKHIYRKICSYLYIAYGEGDQQSFNLNFNSFCSTYSLNATLAYNVISILDRTGILKLEQHYINQTKIKFIVSNDTLFRYLDNNKGIQPITKTILRTYGGIMDNLVKINTDLIRKKAGVTEKEVYDALDILKKENIIDFDHNHTDTVITFLQPREDDKTINRISGIVSQNNDLKKSQVEAVITYINDKNICRNRQLLKYFGEKQSKACGKCSVCLINSKENKNIDYKTIRTNIILNLESKPLSSRRIIDNLQIEEAEVISVLKKLLEEGIVEITPANTYKIKFTS